MADEGFSLIRRVAAEFQQIASLTRSVPSDTLDRLLQADEAGFVADTIAPYLSLPAAVRHDFRETPAARQRLEKLARLLQDDRQLRSGLVEMLSASQAIRTAACRRAFLRVPRHRFVPSAPLAAAYADIAISTHTRDEDGQEVGIYSISAPSIVAMNVGQLRLRPGMRVLEIGAGTGYNAAILAEIVGPGNVTSIDLDAEIVAEARAHLDATGNHEIRVATADGWEGYPERAPYDRIILTVGVHDLSPFWVEQLREGGILVGWFSFRDVQLSAAFRKRNGYLISTDVGGPLWSLDMRGKQPRRLNHHRGDHLTVTHDALDEADLAILDEILDRPAEPFSVPELADLGLAGADFYPFLALAHPLAMQIDDPRVKAQGIKGAAYAIADLERRQVALPIACFGGPEIGEEFRRLAREWRALGRPGPDRLVIAAYPRTTYPRADSLPPGRWMGLIEKEHTGFRWRYRHPARRSALWLRSTERARRVIFFAQEEAAGLGENYVGTEHLLLGLTQVPDSAGAQILSRLSVSLESIREAVMRQVTRGQGNGGQAMQLTPRTKRVIDLAYNEARLLNNNYLGVEHLLLGMLHEGEGPAAQALGQLGVDLAGVRGEVRAMQAP